MDQRATRWAWSMVGVTALSFVLAWSLDPGPASPAGSALTLLLVIGASVHVAASGWLFTLREVRRYARSHTARFEFAPVVLVVVGAVLASSVSSSTFQWVLLVVLCWQMFHFQRQNLGLVALAAAAAGITLHHRERAALTGVAWTGIVALLSRPHLLELEVDPRASNLFGAAIIGWLGCVFYGSTSLLKREPQARPAVFVALYFTALGYAVPLFVFNSPYAAVAGLTIAHGLQYLVLTTIVASGEAPQRRSIALLSLLNIAVLGGIALNYLSHQHDGSSATRAVFGGYLGILAGHFVIDAGIWRLRDEFPRHFVLSHIPWLNPRRNLQPDLPN